MSHRADAGQRDCVGRVSGLSVGVTGAIVSGREKHHSALESIIQLMMFTALLWLLYKVLEFLINILLGLLALLFRGIVALAESCYGYARAAHRRRQDKKLVQDAYLKRLERRQTQISAPPAPSPIRRPLPTPTTTPSNLPKRIVVTARQRVLIEEFREEFPWVLIDIPPRFANDFIREAEWFSKKTGATPARDEQVTILREVSAGWDWEGKP